MATGRNESWWRDRRREPLWSESEVEIGGDWRKKKKEEVQLEPWGSGQGMEVGGLVGLRSRTLCDHLVNNLFLDNIFYFKF